MTEHFSLEELIATQHRGIDNRPPPLVILNLQRTAEGLEQVRALLGAPVTISSGYRCPELNKAVGGQPSSQHLTGLAVDFIAPKFGSPAQIVEKIKASGIKYDQLILEFGRWVHISFTDSPRLMALVIDSSGTRKA